MPETPNRIPSLMGLKQFRRPSQKERLLLYLLCLIIISEFISSFVSKEETSVGEAYRKFQPIPESFTRVPTPPTRKLVTLAELEEKIASEAKPFPPPQEKNTVSALFEIVRDFEDEPILVFYADSLKKGISRALNTLRFYMGAGFKKTIIPIKIHLTDRTSPCPPYMKGVTVPFSKIESEDWKAHIYLYILERYRDKQYILDNLKAETVSGNLEFIRLAIDILLDQKMDIPKIISSGIVSIYQKVIVNGRYHGVELFGSKKLIVGNTNIDDVGERFFYNMYYFSNGAFDISSIKEFFNLVDNRLLNTNRSYLTKAEVKIIFDELIGRDTAPVYINLARICERIKKPELQFYAHQLRVSARHLKGEEGVDLSVEAIFTKRIDSERFNIYMSVCNNGGVPIDYYRMPIEFKIGQTTKIEWIDYKCTIPPYGDIDFCITVDYKELGLKQGDNVIVSAGVDIFNTIQEVDEHNNILRKELTIP